MEEEEARTRMNSMIVEILSSSNLPVKTLLRCRCLCKWISLLISSHYFTTKYHDIASLTITSRRLLLHFNPHHPVTATAATSAAPSGFCPFAHPDDPRKIVSGRCFTVVGSFYGVLCLAFTPHDVCLWNPSTRTHRHLSFPNFEHFDGEEGPANRLVSFGIGYNRDGKPKLLRFVVSFWPESRAFRGEAAIYSVRTDRWKAINCQGLNWNFHVEGLDDRRVNAWEFGKSGICASETINWVVKLYNHQNGAGEFRILSLNLDRDSFKIERIPPIMSPAALDRLLNIDLWAFDDELCFSGYFGGESPEVVVWVHDDEEESWKLLFVIVGSYQRLKPLFYSQDRKKVLMQLDSKILWYKLGTTEFREYNIDLDGSLLDVEAYSESPILIGGSSGRCLRSCPAAIL